MTDHALDKLMRQILIDSLELDMKDGMQGDLIPSKRHQRQMQEMLKNPLGWYKRKTKPVWKLALQRVAVVLLVASLGFGSVVVVSPTVRAAVIRWVVEWYETHVVYRYSGDQMPAGMPLYEITDLPDGYAEDVSERIEHSNLVRKRYRNGNDANAQSIYLTYMYMQQGSASSILTDNCETFDLKINGYAGQMYLQYDKTLRSTITWIIPEENIQIQVDAAGDKEELLRIAESVALVEEKSQMPQYEIARIPDGFIESDRIESSSSVSLFYEDSSGGVICFDYVHMHQGAATMVTIDNNVVDITVNGLRGQLFLPTETKSTTTVAWIDADANIQFVIDTTLDQDVAVAVAESVALVKEKSQMPQYEISVLPNGYRETDYAVLPISVSALYENDSGGIICLDYVYMTEGAAWGFVTEESELLNVTVNGCEGQLFLPDDPENMTTLTWINTEQNLQFCIDAVGDKDTIIRLAESIALKDVSKGGNK